MEKNYTFIAGFPVLETTSAELASHLHERVELGAQTILFYANTNFILNCRMLLNRLSSENVLIVNDGIGMDIAKILVHGKKFKSNLNGTDFTPYFFQQSKKAYRVFLVGGKPEVLNKAAYFLTHHLGQTVVGSCDGYAGMSNSNLISQINESHAEIVLVAMGNPKQEQWILNNNHQLNCKLISGVGALFDFWAGDKPRAPKLVQRLRMEWFFRLCLEPKRLLKRYTIDVLLFLIVCIKYKFTGPDLPAHTEKDIKG